MTKKKEVKSLEKNKEIFVLIDLENDNEAKNFLTMNDLIDFVIKDFSISPLEVKDILFEECIVLCFKDGEAKRLKDIEILKPIYKYKFE